MNSEFFSIDERIQKASEKAMELCKPYLDRTDEITEYNQQKMLKAFQNARVSESYFAASTGYGYGDRGREALDQVFAEVMGAEDALVRHNFASGTHTLTVALFGVLRPGDTMISVTGIHMILYRVLSESAESHRVHLKNLVSIMSRLTFLKTARLILRL